MDTSKFKELKDKYEKYFPAAFFVGGFVFDIITLSRVDDWLSIIQQAVYLLIIIQILKYKIFEQAQTWQPGPRMAKWWSYSDEALHFILGSLLSSYTLFYFVSSSLSTSFLFMAIIFALLIANEFPQLQKSGLILKFALFSICLFSYLFIITALTLGFVGILSFLISLALGTLLPFVMFKQLSSLNLPNIDLKKTLLVPPAAIAVLLISLYTLKLLPPIPLSAQFMGIYHEVEKVRSTEANGEAKTKFLLRYSRPFWKFWQNGDQDFVAQPGDKIYCFVRIFAPNNFKDRVVYHWLKKYPTGWQTMDKINNDISGGRTEGFRGFAIKSNFEPGDWRVQLETTDGREIGRISFTVTLSDLNPDRTYKLDYY